MATESRHLAAPIERSFADVYEFAADPGNVTAWAPGLASTLKQVDGQWVADSPMGRITIAFTPPNPYGVLDHDVTMPSGEVVHNAFRVLPDGDGAEVVFTVRRRPGMTDDDFARDAAAVTADLLRLKDVLERGA
jgi:hypothetical protein